MKAELSRVLELLDQAPTSLACTAHVVKRVSKNALRPWFVLSRATMLRLHLLLRACVCVYPVSMMFSITHIPPAAPTYKCPSAVALMPIKPSHSHNKRRLLSCIVSVSFVRVLVECQPVAETPH